MRATDAEVKAAYKRLAMQYHPDRNQGSKFHEEHFKKIAEAYQTLSNKDRRDSYDIKLFYDSLGSFGSSRSASQPTPESRPQPSGYGPPPHPGSSRTYGGSTAHGPGHYADSDPHYAHQKRGYGGPRRRDPKLSLHAGVFYMIFVAMFVTFSVWIGNIVNRQKAEDLTELGKYNDALRADDTYAKAWVLRGREFILAGATIDGMESINRAFENAETPMPDAYHWMAIAKMQRSEWPEAISNFRTELKIRPGTDSVMNLIGSMYLYRLNKPDSALYWFEQALQQNKGNQLALFGQGYARLNLGRYAEAVKSFNLSKDAGCQRADMYLYRGYAHLGLGDSLSACADFTYSAGMGFDEALEPAKMCIGKLQQQ